MKILIAPNSFKQCSDSVSLSKLLYEFLSKRINTDYLISPISDGGDGFLNVCDYHFNGKILTYLISTAYDNSKFKCDVLYDVQKNEIYIESADIIGMKVIPAEKMNAILLSSKGLGELLKLIAKDCSSNRIEVNRVIIGIGGTATIDMGLGACSALGFKLFGEKNKELTVIPKNFHKVKSVEWEQLKLPFTLSCILDVNNPLFGEKGGIKIYGKQKGASKNEINIIEKGMGNILQLISKRLLIKKDLFLSGAGGGIPAGLKLFFGSKDVSAEEFILNYLKLQSKITCADMLITGEGSFDEQSFMGKGAGILVREALKLEKRIFLICGKVSEEIKMKMIENTMVIELRKFFENEEESISNYKKGIEMAAELIAKVIKA